MDPLFVYGVLFQHIFGIKSIYFLFFSLPFIGIGYFVDIACRVSYNHLYFMKHLNNLNLVILPH